MLNRSSRATSRKVGRWPARTFFTTPYIPVRLYPAVLAIFEVWQNALAGVRNAVSRAILTQCAEWLRDLQTPSSTEEPEARSARWEQVADIGEFGKSLSQLILRASLAEPAFAEEYLERVIG